MHKSGEDFKIRFPANDSVQTFHCFSVYGVDPRILKEKWFEIFSAIVGELKISVNKLYYEFDRDQSNTTKSVSTIEKLKGKLQLDGRGLSYAIGEEVLKGGMPGQNRSVSINIDIGSIYVCFRASLNDAIEISKSLSSEVAVFHPSYGFLVHGPDGFFVHAWCAGVSYDGMSIGEERAVQRLSSGRTKMKENLHDLYVFNLLTNKHLDRRVGQSSLRDFISDTGAGSLTEIPGGLSVWILDVKEINATREILVDSGIVF